LADLVKAWNRKEIATPQIPGPPPHPTTQEGNIQVTGMVRRNDEPTGPGNCANDSIMKTEPADGPDKNPQDPIENRTHNLAAITTII
jgi:hypothetical protein